MLKKIFTSIFILALSITGLAGNTATALAVGPTCPQLSVGDEIKVNETNKPAIYVLDKDMHPRYFADGDIYKTYKETYKDFKLIDQRCLESLGTPGGYPSSINYRPGSQVVRSPFDDKLYVVLPGNALAPITESVAKQLYGSNYKVVTINPNQWSQYVCKKSEQVTKAHPGMVITTDPPGGLRSNFYIDSVNKIHPLTFEGMRDNFLLDKYVYYVSDNLVEGLVAAETITGPVAYLTDRTQSSVACDGTSAEKDMVPPVVTISNPTSLLVKDTVNFTATATDNVGVKKVEFLVNDKVIGSDDSAPYAINWDTKNFSNEGVTLYAKAYDAYNVTISPGVMVKIDNSTTTVQNGLRIEPAALDGVTGKDVFVVKSASAQAVYAFKVTSEKEAVKLTRLILTANGLGVDTLTTRLFYKKGENGELKFVTTMVPQKCPDCSYDVANQTNLLPDVLERNVPVYLYVKIDVPDQPVSFAKMHIELKVDSVEARSVENNSLVKSVSQSIPGQDFFLTPWHVIMTAVKPEEGQLVADSLQDG
jgi:hypothetical protein